MIRLTITLLATLWANFAGADPLKVAVTTSFHNSGLSDVLLPAIQEATGIELQILVVGSGQALRLGQAGDVDAVLVHAKSAEEAFVAAGHATRRIPFMYNDFVLIGPQADPADVAGASTAAQGLERIATSKSPFVSRGDDSGTHQKELSLWAQTGATNLSPNWYRSVGAGMGAALNTASGLNAYILSDRATWLTFANKGDLQLLFEGDASLFNQYSFLPMNAINHPHVKAAAAEALGDWLASPQAGEVIDAYRLAGEQLFTFNATD